MKAAGAGAGPWTRAAASRGWQREAVTAGSVRSGELWARAVGWVVAGALTLVSGSL